MPRCVFSGIVCELGTKETLVEAGFVACWPLESRLQDNWPISVTVEAETADGALYRRVIQNATGNPLAVAAVRRFNEYLQAGKMPTEGTHL